MTMIDSSVWVDYFNGQQTPTTVLLDSLLGVQLIATGDLILTEVLQGFSIDKDYERAKALMSTLHFFPLGGRAIALKSADNYRILRKRGITIRKTVDMFIGTFCIENNIPLLHADKDFDPLEEYLGLQVIK